MTVGSPGLDISETKSHTSQTYKSTHSSRSSVLERARSYTRRMDDGTERRASSMERSSSGTPRSSTGGGGGGRPTTPLSTRERAMASVERDSTPRGRGGREPPTTPGSVRTQGDATVSTHQTRPSVATATSTQQGSQATRPSLRMTNRSSAVDDPHPQAAPDQLQEAVVSPELLVDALSGHEDGLLAIAERMMEHYDRGYDAMGEAIIDAFADVQKLFQHVVEAAHMEGAAFEASRREDEMKELRRQAAEAGGLPHPVPVNEADADADATAQSPVGPVRHDEFIDQDVKDCLSEAIRQGAPLKESNKHAECFDLYERACQSASSLLPVDSDHRGRLQLSIARAESMSPDRGCAILRYAMDDVLRSGLRAGHVPLPDLSKRADVVLQKPKTHPSMNGSTGQAGVVQSSEEQLNSLVEEMKEILEAPVYKDTALQEVTKRFWVALQDTHKQQTKTEDRLEQSLGKLKGDFLLARAEWEEKLTRAEEQSEQLKKKFVNMKEGGNLMEEARNMSQRLAATHFGEVGTGEDKPMGFHSQNGRGPRGAGNGAESIASLSSSMAHHARTLVGQFACTGINERTDPVVATEFAEGGTDLNGRTTAQWRDRRHAVNQQQHRQQQAQQGGSGGKAYATAAPGGATSGPSGNRSYRVVDV